MAAVLAAAFAGFVRLARVLTGLAFLVLIAAVLIQVLGRTFLHQAPVWTEELARYGLIFIAALGAGLSLRSGDLVNVDILTNALPARARRLTSVLALALTAGLAAAVLPSSFEFVAIGEWQTSPTLGLRMDAVFAAMPILIAMLLVFAAARLAGVDRGPGRDAGPDAGPERG